MKHFRNSFLSTASAETRSEVANFIRGLRILGHQNNLVRRAALVAYMPE